MGRADELQQQIWEFVYGLLPEDESLALRKQISSDPDAARLYAEVKLQTEIVAEAARVKAAPIDFGTVAVKRQQPERVVAGHSRRRKRLIGLLGWAVSLAASLLVAFVGWSYVKPQSPLRPVTFQTERQWLTTVPVQAVVLGPRQLQPRPANNFAVVTRSLDGQPRSAALTYRLYGERDHLLVENHARTGPDGLLHIQSPPEIEARRVRLEVQTEGAGDLALLTHTFDVETAELTTHVIVDKPLCRPGQTLRYRTVTLSRYDLQVRHEVEVQVEIRGPEDQPLADLQSRGRTERGVFHGEFAIPEDFPDGVYRLVVRSPQGLFAEARRDVVVRHFQMPRLRKRLEFARDSYGPGDDVRARFSVASFEGGSLADVPLRVRAEVGGQVVVDHPAVTDARGNYDLNFAMPAAPADGEARLSVTVMQDHMETLNKPIPFAVGDVEVAFFPESGDLVAEVDNRVYFRALDGEGKPVHVEGWILDELDERVAAVRTQRDGRGVFAIVPREGATYRLRIDRPAGTSTEPRLPAVSAEQFVVFDTSQGVVEADAPLRLTLRSARRIGPLMVMATCRGAVVGQQMVAEDPVALRSDGSRVRSVLVPLAENAEGVIRVTAYDLAMPSPRPVAERLVYRRPRQRLTIGLDGLQPAYAPGEQLDLALEIRDESGHPRPAVLGIRVIDDALLTLADDPLTSLTTHFWLTGALADARGLEDANFYLQPDDPAAVEALDLLLGTQGWRRFGRPESALALADRAEVFASRARGRFGVAVQDSAAPHVVADNAGSVQAMVAGSLSSLRAARQADLRRSGLIVLVGGLVLLVAALGLSLMQPSGALRRGAPHLAAAALCLIVGIVWVAADIDSQGQLTWSPAAGGQQWQRLARREDRPQPAADLPADAPSSAATAPESAAVPADAEAWEETAVPMDASEAAPPADAARDPVMGGRASQRVGDDGPGSGESLRTMSRRGRMAEPDAPGPPLAELAEDSPAAAPPAPAQPPAPAASPQRKHPPVRRGSTARSRGAGRSDAAGAARQSPAAVAAARGACRPGSAGPRPIGRTTAACVRRAATCPAGTCDDVAIGAVTAGRSRRGRARTCWTIAPTAVRSSRSGRQLGCAGQRACRGRTCL
jgi:hypothetical protein